MNTNLALALFVQLPAFIVQIALALYCWRTWRAGLVEDCTVEVGHPDDLVHVALRVAGSRPTRYRFHPSHAREVSGDLLRAHAALQGVRTRDEAPKNTRRETAAS